MPLFYLKLSTSRGFTFLELIVALTLSAIIALCAIPALKSFAITPPAKADAQKIAAFMELLTIKAMYLRDQIIVKKHGYELWAIRESNPKKIIMKRSIKGDNRINLGREELLFYDTGVCTPASISIVNIHQRCLIRLSLRGRTSIDCSQT